MLPQALTMEQLEHGNVSNDDPHGVKEMDWMQLEFYADGHDPMRAKVAHARAEIRRREAEERNRNRAQRSADVTRRISSRIELQKQKLQASADMIERQEKISQRISSQQLKVARASAWAAALAAIATMHADFVIGAPGVWPRYVGGGCAERG